VANLGYLLNTCIHGEREYFVSETLYSDMVASHITLPHPKRSLRIRSLADWVASHGCDEDNPQYPDREQVCGFLKKDEWAKPGKIPRQVVSMGVTRSIYGAHVAEDVKQSLAEVEDDEDGHCIVFVKSPEYEQLREVFNRLVLGDYSAIFSDDMCVSYRTVDGLVYRANLDISGCDASHTRGVFDVAQELANGTEYQTIMRNLIAQCAEPFVLCSGEDSMRFRPTGPILYSGSVLTTLINTIASRQIARHVASRARGATLQHIRENIQAWLDETGYDVTAEECHTPEELQFLKHSPYLSGDGTLVPQLNLGVVLSSMGQKVGDLPGQGDLVQRAIAFNASLTASLVHSGENSVLYAFRRKYPNGVILPEHQSKLEDAHGAHVEDHEICKRYGITVPDLQELVDLIDQSKIGDVINCVASRAIILKDYGR